MDLRLPLLADANLHLGVAEEAADEEAWVTAEEEVDKADQALQQLREQWPQMADNERGLLAQMVAPLKHRADSLRERLPKKSVVSQGEKVIDPEQEEEPES